MRPDVAELLPKLVRAFDQPFADSSAIPNWYLSRMTRQHVTVALSVLFALIFLYWNRRLLLGRAGQ